MRRADEERPRSPKRQSTRDSDRTQQAILAAAEEVFAEQGLSGARVDVIAKKSGTNKQMIYYYFNSKENLYRTVLERSYLDMRLAEQALELRSLPPLDAIRRLVEFKCDYDYAHPRFVRLLAAENFENAAHLAMSDNLREMHQELIRTLRTIINAGETAGLIRMGIDPLQLYITISSLSFFFFSNSATLSIAFGENLRGDAKFRERRTHATEVIMDYVRAR